jgi:hypothetical protein
MSHVFAHVRQRSLTARTGVDLRQHALSGHQRTHLSKHLDKGPQAQPLSAALIGGIAVVLLIFLFSGLPGSHSQRITTDDMRGVAVCVDEQMRHRSAIDEARLHPDWPIPYCS